VEASYSCFIL